MVSLFSTPGFDDAALRIVVAHIAHASGQLMEIVNFNVEAEQYVCAGHVSKPRSDNPRIPPIGLTRLYFTKRFLTFSLFRYAISIS